MGAIDVFYAEVHVGAYEYHQADIDLNLSKWYVGYVSWTILCSLLNFWVVSGRQVLIWHARFSCIVNKWLYNMECWKWENALEKMHKKMKTLNEM